MILFGTTINALSVVVGSLIGILLTKLFSKSPRLAEVPQVALKAISLCVIFIGIQGAFDSSKPLVLILSLVVGSILGTVLNIDGGLQRLGTFVEKKFVKKPLPPQEMFELDETIAQRNVARAFVSTTLACCVGALTITAAMQSGVSEGQEQTLMYAKIVLDFVTAIVFASSFGFGAALAAIPIFVYQGALELIFYFAGPVIPQGTINEMSAAGSIIIIALGLNMLGSAKVKIANLIPAMFMPLLFCLFL
ncbi:MAG: DUF554 domain-containing protein [Clostridia bacterium]|nr:DUF554 domain-containing protein [Clostridia bacterium]